MKIIKFIPLLILMFLTSCSNKTYQTISGTPFVKFYKESSKYFKLCNTSKQNICGKTLFLKNQGIFNYFPTEKLIIFQDKDQKYHLINANIGTIASGSSIDHLGTNLWLIKQSDSSCLLLNSSPEDYKIINVVNASMDKGMLIVKMAKGVGILDNKLNTIIPCDKNCIFLHIGDNKIITKNYDANRYEVYSKYKLLYTISESQFMHLSNLYPFCM